MRTAIFGLATAERDVDMPGGTTSSLRKDGLSKTPVSYMDYTTNGDRLYRRLSVGRLQSLDFVGVIQDAWPIETVEAIERLLGDRPGDLPDGRVSLYVCPECADLGCGAVTARITLDADTATWSALGIQTDYASEIDLLAGDGTVTDITFERGTYQTVLQRELERISPLRQRFEYPYERQRRLRQERRTKWLRRLFP